MKVWCLPVLATVLLVGGCAKTKVSITYRSDPEYATLYEVPGKRMGTCPVTLIYRVDAEDRLRGTMSVRGVKARWVSGAETVYSLITVDLSNGYKQQFTCVRPLEAPNAEIDAEYAIQKEQNALMDRQVKVQEYQKYRNDHWHTVKVPHH